MKHEPNPVRQAAREEDLPAAWKPKTSIWIGDTLRSIAKPSIWIGDTLLSIADDGTAYLATGDDYYDEELTAQQVACLRAFLEAHAPKEDEA